MSFVDYRLVIQVSAEHVVAQLPQTYYPTFQARLQLHPVANGPPVEPGVPAGSSASPQEVGRITFTVCRLEVLMDIEKAPPRTKLDRRLRAALRWFEHGQEALQSIDSDLLFVHELFVEPAWRGHDLGRHALRLLMDIYGGGCAAVAVVAEPPRGGRRSRERTREQRLALRRYFADMGFVLVDELSGLMALDLGVVQNRLWGAEKNPLFSVEEEKP